MTKNAINDTNYEQKAFLKALQEKGINVRFETKLNGPQLSQMISDIVKT